MNTELDQKPTYFSRRGLSEIVTDEELGLLDFYIFFSAAVNVEPNGWVFFSEDQYDYSIDLDPEDIDDSIARLVKCGYLIEGPEGGGERMLRISPEVVVDESVALGRKQAKRVKLKIVDSNEQ